MSATPDQRQQQIVQLIAAQGVPFRVHEHVVARTVADASEKLAFPAEHYLKTVVFRVKHGPWLVVGRFESGHIGEGASGVSVACSRIP